MSFEKIACLICALALAGCSALINPDDGRLGGDDDAGAAGRDAGRMDGGGDDDAGRGDAGPDGAVPSDGGPVCPPSCDDDVACTVDACEDGRCAHTADDGACADGERCNPVLGCVPIRCTSDPECDDGVFCNGVERCDGDAPGTGCVAGDPVVCDDGASCSADRCDEDADRCVATPDDSACADAVDCTVDRCDPAASSSPTGCVSTPNDAMCAGDFCTVGRRCNPTAGCVGGTDRDCRDGDPCTADSCDEVGDMCISTLRDEDGDGFGAASVIAGGSVVMCGGPDCDDMNAGKYPGAPELCNGIDDNCDGVIDEGCSTTPDDCGSARQITVGPAGTATVTGTFGALADDYRTNAICGAQSGGRDAVYFIDVPRGQHDVTIDTIGSTADTVLGLGFTCDMRGFQTLCNDDYDRRSTTDSRLWLHRVGSGATSTRVYILVDAYDSSVTGSYTLNVRVDAPAVDGCSAPGGQLDITGGGALVGFQSSFVGNQRGTCTPGAFNPPEAILSLTAPSSGRVEFDAYSADFTPDLYLRRAACDGPGASELDCVNGSSVGGGINGASLNETVTAGDRLWLFVDGGRTSYAVYYQPF